jgi:hypothetical protein
MVEERTQRRLAAILAADVVGYSRLMEADEEGTLHRLQGAIQEGNGNWGWKDIVTSVRLVRTETHPKLPCRL